MRKAQRAILCVLRRAQAGFPLIRDEIACLSDEGGLYGARVGGEGNREKVANYLNKRLLLPPSSMTEAPAEAPKTNESFGSRHFLGNEVRLVVQR